MINNALNALRVYQNAQSVSIDAKSKDKAELQKQANNFEALLLKRLLDEALSNNDSLFGNGAGSEIRKSMYTEAVAKQLSGSFGYSQVLFEYLQNKS